MNFNYPKEYLDCPLIHAMNYEILMACICSVICILKNYHE